MWTVWASSFISQNIFLIVFVKTFATSKIHDTMKINTIIDNDDDLGSVTCRLLQELCREDRVSSVTHRVEKKQKKIIFPSKTLKDP